MLTSKTVDNEVGGDSDCIWQQSLRKKKIGEIES